MKINRETFLRRLEEVQPGLAYKEMQEQSSCFIFTRGYIVTFNEEIACRTKSGLGKEVTGAVQSKKFLEMLRNFPDEIIDIEFDDKQVLLKGKGRASGIKMEKEIVLPFDSVDKPEDWNKIHKDFTDAVGIVQSCATKNQTAFTLTCVHIHPNWMEAFDNTQLVRYKLKTGVSKPFLVKKDSIKYVPSYDFTSIAETSNWLHFKTDAGTIMSVRRYVAEAADYQNLTDIISISGTPTTLPKALGEAAKRAEIMSSVDLENNLALISIKPGILTITGEGDAGWYREKKKLKYSGEPIKFKIAPQLLVEILKRNHECEISKDRKLKIDGGKFKYVACLRKV